MFIWPFSTVDVFIWLVSHIHLAGELCKYIHLPHHMDVCTICRLDPIPPSFFCFLASMFREPLRRWHHHWHRRICIRFGSRDNSMLMLLRELLQEHGVERRYISAGMGEKWRHWYTMLVGHIQRPRKISVVDKQALACWAAATSSDEAAKLYRSLGIGISESVTTGFEIALGIVGVVIDALRCRSWITFGWWRLERVEARVMRIKPVAFQVKRLANWSTVFIWPLGVRVLLSPPSFYLLLSISIQSSPLDHYHGRGGCRGFQFFFKWWLVVFGWWSKRKIIGIYLCFR